MTGKRGASARWWLAGAVVVVVGILLPFVWEHAGADLKVYRLGGSTILADPATLYTARLKEISMPFTYPVFGALVMVPVALLPWAMAYSAAIAASLVALAVIWRMCLGDRHPAELVAVVAASLLLEPVRETLSYGQINLVLCAVILYDVLDTKHPRRGIWLGLAAGIKLTPLVFFGLLLVTRQWKALLHASAAFLATVAIGFLVAPRTALDYWTNLLADTSRIGGLAYSGNQSWNGFLIRLTGNLEGGGRTWQLLVAITVLAGLYLTRVLWLRNQHLAAVSVCAMIALCCSPVSWSHHWVWCIPLGVALLQALDLRWRPFAGVLWFGLFAIAPIWWPPRRDNRELTWTFVQHLEGNAYPWLTLTAAVILAFHAKKTTREEASRVVEETAA